MRKNTMQRKDDIRFDRRPVAVQHESARGEIVRNVGAFTRGSQLIRLRYMMMMEGLRWPALAWPCENVWNEVSNKAGNRYER